PEFPLSKADSLKDLLKMAPKDSSKVRILNLLSYEMKRKNPDSALFYAQLAHQLAKEVGNNKGLGAACNNIGEAYRVLSNYDDAIENYQQALKIFDEIKYERGKAGPLNNMGLVYTYLGEYEKSIEFFLQSLKIKEETGNVKRTSSSLNNIGLVYNSQGDYEKSIEYYYKALKISKKYNDKIGIGIAYNNIGLAYANQGEYQEAFEYYNKSFEVRKAIGDKRGLGSSYNNIGLLYMDQGYYEKALLYLLESAKIKEKLNNRRGVAGQYNNIGLIHKEMGDYEKALEYYYKALRIKEEIGDKKRIPSSCLNIGNIYKLQGKDSLAMKYYFRSLRINQENGNKKGMALTSISIGNMYNKMDSLDASLNYLLKGLLLQEEINDKRGLIFSLNGLGNLYLKKKVPVKAIHYFHKSTELAKEIGARKRLSDSYNWLANAFEEIKNYEKAYYSLRQHTDLKDSLLTDKNSKNIARMQALYESEKKDKEILLLNKDKEIKELALSKERAELKKQKIFTYSVIGGSLLLAAMAFLVYRGYRQKKLANIQLETINAELEKLSIVASETDNAVIIANADGEIEWVNAGFTKMHGYTLEEFIKQKGANLNQVSGDADTKHFVKASIEKKKTISYEILNVHKSGKKVWVHTTITPILDQNNVLKKLVAIDTDITERKKAEEIIRQKNIDITDSITYAKQIQHAILVPEEEIYRVMPESFIFFKPRDIVSGDFYWFNETASNSSKDKNVIIAACDCTGHGVPGAFMSMIGNEILNNIVKEQGITDPAGILKRLHEGIRKALQQDREDAESHDGMDVALCNINLTQRKVVYAGALRPLYCIYNNGTAKAELQIVKADKIGVGGALFKLNREYTNHEIQLSKGDTVYIFSDGITDQFGGERGKKYMSKNFGQYLCGFQQKNMTQQREALEAELKEWQGKYSQVDDILVIGVRV
ncbi:tetratricopeptide repeat protein, partial [Candidatus Amoebophilus asiaticus]|nr:tetratricopeptide repeat protein [Candidatus Amoebophilus asiaticus]